MPIPEIPPELSPVITRFTKDQKRFTASVKGRSEIKQMTMFAKAVGLGLSSDRASQTPKIPDGRSYLQWISRMPLEIIKHREAPLIDFEAIGGDEGYMALDRSMEMLVLGVVGLLHNKEPLAKDIVGQILQVAFGADPVADALRKGMGKGIGKRFQPPLPNTFTLPSQNEIARFILSGTVRELLQSFARCGVAASDGASWLRKVVPIGRVVRLSKSKACAGDQLVIDYDLGATPPSPGNDIFLSLPRRFGCTHPSLKAIRPDLFTPNGWQASGTISIELPGDIFTGCLGFFTAPPAPSASCLAGELAVAAGMFQGALAGINKDNGIVRGQLIVDIVAKIEAGRDSALPCAMRQADSANALSAGAPVIDSFRALETGPIYPRGYVTLQWSVDNADHVEIIHQMAHGSIGDHELPPIPGNLPLKDQRQITIPVTRRWEGQYILRASNANGCTTTPLEAVVDLRSGYSIYHFGAAKVDITDTRPGLPMLGFSDEAQKSSGEIDLRQYARAFVVEENNGRPDASRIAMVVCDFWGCSQMLKNAVIAALNHRPGQRTYDEASLIIGGTHTHSGPGGYFEYFLYNLTGKGFDQQLFNLLVNGIVASVGQAESRMVPGSIYVNSGEVTDCGANRSLEAYLRNIDATPGDPSQWTDRSMTLLKFVEDVNDFGATRLVGAINWFAIHPTSLGMFNTRISGDSKGWAADKLERELRRDSPGFVAAFANAAAGDVSGNLTLNSSGTKTVTMPLGIPGDAGVFNADHSRMMTLAQRQFEAALGLLTQATEVISGPIAVRHTNIDMSNVAISNTPGARTWPAAMGVSFGAGSSEDSLARVQIAEGMMINSHIMEGYTTASRVLGAAEAAHLVIPLALTIVGAAIGQVPIVIASPGRALPAIIGSAQVIRPTPQELASLLDNALTLLPPHGCAFVTSTVANLIFPERLTAAQGENGDVWQWEMPCFTDWPLDFVAGHGEKPIMLAPGLTSLVRTPSRGAPVKTACPLVPHVIPMHLVCLGQLAISGVPAEFTSTAGRRLKASLLNDLSGIATQSVVFGYANAYSGYVTTLEEYNAQHYEGASTLYGPNTLAAYIQTFGMLANAIRTNSEALGDAPFTPPAITRRPG